MQYIIYRERLEPMSNLKSRLSLIVQVNVVLKRTFFYSEDDYGTGCQNVNNNSPIQDFVHPDDQTQPTSENIYHKVDASRLLGGDPLRSDYCKRQPPVSELQVFTFWVVAYYLGVMWQLFPKQY